MKPPSPHTVVVRDWRIWTPTLSGHKDALTQHAPALEKADLPFPVPKNLARRFSPLARAVLNVGGACAGTDCSMPVVFSTAHAESNSSLAMLKDLQRGEELSPTAFSLSVHNAIAGLFSMAMGNHAEITVLAPGEDGIAPAFIEALGLLQEGHPEVLVVFYDEPLSDFFPTEPFKLNTQETCALALKLALAGEGMRLGLSRTATLRNDGEHAAQLLMFWDFLNSDAETLILGNRRLGWQWQKN